MAHPLISTIVIALALAWLLGSLAHRLRLPPIIGFVLGVALGALIRRTVPAMAATLAITAAIQFVIPNWVRPDLVTPATLTGPVLGASALGRMQMQTDGQLTVPVDIPGAWIVSNQTITPGGQVFTLPVVPQCQTGTESQCVAWIAGRHLRQVNMEVHEPGQEHQSAGIDGRVGQLGLVRRGEHAANPAVRGDVEEAVSKVESATAGCGAQDPAADRERRSIRESHGGRS